MATIDPSTYKTGNPIGSNAPEDVSDNARCFDAFSTSDADYYLDRLGKKRPTATGQRKAIGWKSAGEWTSDPALTDPTEYTWLNNQRFVPVNLPYTVDSATNPNPQLLVDSGVLVDISEYLSDKNLPEYLGKYSDFAFSSVASMKALTTVGGKVISDDIDSGQILETSSYYGGLFTAGSAMYLVSSLQDVRNSLSDQSWNPDELTDHTLANGLIAVLIELGNGTYLASQSGLRESNTAEENSNCIDSAISRAKTTPNTIYARTVTIDSGLFLFSRPIANIPDAGSSQRLIGIRGTGRGKTELKKSGTATVNVRGVDVDAVIAEAPEVNSDYAYFGNCGGFTLSRSSELVGYGYYSVKCPASKRTDMHILRAGNGYYTEDCWMSHQENIWAIGSGDTGISILGGTSNTGSNLYSDGSKKRGFNFRGLTYSELHCSADRTAVGEVDSGVAYDFALSKGVSGQFSCETTHGKEFNFENSDGVVITGGRSFNSAPVATLTSKIRCVSSTVNFTGFDWSDSITNLTTGEKANYNLINKDSLSTVDFDACVNSYDLDNRFPRQLDFKFAGNTESSTYSSRNGLVTHTIALDKTQFKKLCYVENAGRIKLEIGLCTNNTMDLMYLPITDVGIYIPNVSTSAGSPTALMDLYENGSKIAATLEGFVQDGWLYVRPSNDGNNRTYHFRAFTLPLF